MGFAGKLVLSVGILGLALLAFAGILYVVDYGVQATVVAKQCSTGTAGIFGSPAGPGTITVQAKLVPLKYTMKNVPAQQCNSVQVDNFVIYHVRSERTSLYQADGGSCIYDSVHGVGGCAA